MHGLLEWAASTAVVAFVDARQEMEGAAGPGLSLVSMLAFSVLCFYLYRLDSVA